VWEIEHYWSLGDVNGEARWSHQLPGEW